MNTKSRSNRPGLIARSLCGLALIGVCASAASHANAEVLFIQTATVANVFGNWTDLSVKDSNPYMLYFATPNWNPTASAGVYDIHPIGVRFDAAHNDWSIFNQDGALMPHGASFNVVGVPIEADAYLHTATAANSMGDYTVLDNPFTNNDPNATVWVTPNWNPGNKGGIYNNHNIGVWYNKSLGRWAIFNQDGTAIPHGASFNVTYGTGSLFPNYYVHRATINNSTGDYTILDDPLINGANGHLVMVTCNWNPGGLGGIYNNHPIGVWYNNALKRYGIFNQDGTAIPHGACFNVWVAR